MKYGYARVSTKGQLDGNSIEEQTTAIKNLYADAEIIVESYSGAKERPFIQSNTGTGTKRRLSHRHKARPFLSFYKRGIGVHRPFDEQRGKNPYSQHGTD